MKKNIMKSISRHIALVGFIGMAGLTAMVSSCNPEPDESDLFTATGETCIDLNQYQGDNRPIRVLRLELKR